MSELAKLIAKRERQTYEFDTAGFLGLGGKPIAKVSIRVATKGEQDRAVIAAHRYIEDIAKAGSIDSKVALDDRDILVDAKACFILFEVCRDVADPKYPAFPGPRWMIDHLSADEISVLLNCYAEVLRRVGTVDFDLSTDRIEALSAALASTADTDAPNVYLTRYTREQLCEITVRQAVLLSQARSPCTAST